MTKRITVQFTVGDSVDADAIRNSLARGIETGLDEVTLLAVNENIDEIAKEARVCPHCGSESFEASRSVMQRYYCNSEAMPFSVIRESWEGQNDLAKRPDFLLCSVCGEAVDRYEVVPEWFFHNVICSEDWDDTALVVVSDRETDEIKDVMTNIDSAPGWSQGRSIDRRDVKILGGMYTAEIHLINSGPPTVDIAIYKHEGNEKTVVTALEESPVYFGEFEFHLRDQLTPDGDQFDRKFRLIVMSESDLKNIQEPENNTVTDGNTTGNEDETEESK